MTYRDADFEDAIVKMVYDDKAFSYILKVRREVEGYREQKDLPDFMAEPVAYYSRILAAIEPVHCDCCEREITQVYRRGEFILGSECKDHPIGSCRAAPPLPEIVVH